MTKDPPETIRRVFRLLTKHAGLSSAMVGLDPRVMKERFVINLKAYLIGKPSRRRIAPSCARPLMAAAFSTRLATTPVQPACGRF